ncbi:hypothetical protein AAKU67_002739 [Oxalobacteraceae bacterium GrIS 2.11]
MPISSIPPIRTTSVQMNTTESKFSDAVEELVDLDKRTQTAKHDAEQKLGEDASINNALYYQTITTDIHMKTSLFAKVAHSVVGGAMDLLKGQ